MLLIGHHFIASVAGRIYTHVLCVQWCVRLSVVYKHLESEGSFTDFETQSAN